MRETGAALGCRITEWMDASIHGLIRDEEHGVESRVFSAQTRLAPAPWMDMEVEAARGEKDSRDKEALRAMISSQLRGCSTIITYVDADPISRVLPEQAPPGPRRLCPCGGGRQGDLSFCARPAMPKQGLYPSQAPIDTRVRTGIDWNRDRATTYSIGVAGRRLKDRLPTPLTDYTEGTLRAGILKNLERVSFNLSAEGGAAKRGIQRVVLPVSGRMFRLLKTRGRALVRPASPLRGRGRARPLGHTDHHRRRIGHLSSGGGRERPVQRPGRQGLQLEIQGQVHGLRFYQKARIQDGGHHGPGGTQHVFRSRRRPRRNNPALRVCP